MDHLTDEQLAQRAQAGEREALGVLLTRHRDNLFSLSMRILGRREDALDATQDACLRVCRHLHSFDPNRSFGAWLRRVTVRAALDHARKRTALAGDPDGEEQLQDPRPDPRQSVQSREIGRAVADALSELSPTQRTVFVCREIEGMDTAEIARAMGCLRATVRWHLFEARRRLAERLAPFAGGGS